MDFKSLKEKALELKKKTASLKKKAEKKYGKFVDERAKKLEASDKIIDDKERLDEFVKQTLNSLSETGKEFVHRGIVIFAEPGTEFYKEAMYILPVLNTKGWTQNVKVRVSNL